MTITATQAAERAKGIGSSDAAAVMGLSPFLTPYELWMQKTGRSEGFAGNEATKRGDILEPAILEMVAVEIEQKVVQPTSTFVKGILRANVDGMVGKFARGSTIETKYMRKASVTSVPQGAMNSSSIVRVLPATVSSGMRW